MKDRENIVERNQGPVEEVEVEGEDGLDEDDVE